MQEIMIFGLPLSHNNKQIEMEYHNDRTSILQQVQYTVRTRSRIYFALASNTIDFCFALDID